jgi:hypothetical protein
MARMTRMTANKTARGKIRGSVRFVWIIPDHAFLRRLVLHLLIHQPLFIF